MPQISPDQIVMIVLGAALLIAGLTLLRLRPSAPPSGTEGEEVPHEVLPTSPLGLSEPSRLTISVVMLVVGYHLVMWALPARWASAAAVPRDLWYVVAGVAVVAIASSLLLDWSSASRRDR